MTEQEAQRILDEVMKAHWPNWNFAGEELLVWLKELRKFDFELARDAINELYLSWESDRYPKIKHVMASIRNVTHSRRQASRRIMPLFEITDEEGKRIWRPFVGDANMSHELMNDIAEKLRDQANRMYPQCKHIVFYFDTRPKEEIDNGYYGPDARQRAIESILTRPDGDKTKQWLQRHINNKRSTRIDEPVKIEEAIPF